MVSEVMVRPIQKSHNFDVFPLLKLSYSFYAVGYSPSLRHNLEVKEETNPKTTAIFFTL
jgi:hypothetical protein